MGRAAGPSYKHYPPEQGPSKIRSHLTTLGRKKLHYYLRVPLHRRAVRQVVITGFVKSKVHKAKDGDKVDIDMVAQLYDEKGLDVIAVETIEDPKAQARVEAALRKKGIIKDDDVVHFYK